MIGPPPGTRVYLACGVTDMRRGFDSLSAQVESVLKLDPYGGAVFIFRGRRGDLLKGLYYRDCATPYPVCGVGTCGSSLGPRPTASFSRLCIWQPLLGWGT